MARCRYGRKKSGACGRKRGPKRSYRKKRKSYRKKRRSSRRRGRYRRCVRIKSGKRCKKPRRYRRYRKKRRMKFDDGMAFPNTAYMRKWDGIQPGPHDNGPIRDPVSGKMGGWVISPKGKRCYARGFRKDGKCKLKPGRKKSSRRRSRRKRKCKKRKDGKCDKRYKRRR